VITSAFALSLSKRSRRVLVPAGFDKLSPNGLVSAMDLNA